MLDIRQELKILLIKKCTSMSKVVASTKGSNRDIPSESTISTELRTNRIRFQTVQDILDELGYEFAIIEKQK